MSAPAIRILYDAKTAAEMLSTSQRSIDDLRRGGKLIAVKHGRAWKYRHEDLVAYADSLQTSMETS